MVPPYWGWVLPPQWNLSGNTSETCSEVCLLVNSKSCSVKFTRLVIRARRGGRGYKNGDSVITITQWWWCDHHYTCLVLCMHVCISSRKPQYLPVNGLSSLFQQNHKLGHSMAGNIALEQMSLEPTSWPLDIYILSQIYTSVHANTKTRAPGPLSPVQPWILLSWLLKEGRVSSPPCSD